MLPPAAENKCMARPEHTAALSPQIFTRHLIKRKQNNLQ